MKDTADQGTGDMFGVKRGRGRPKTGGAKSGAERQATYRAKQQGVNVTVTIIGKLPTPCFFAVLALSQPTPYYISSASRSPCIRGLVRGAAPSNPAQLSCLESQ